jgi:pimeloyl-ACP methyl ester carboxylesterase
MTEWVRAAVTAMLVLVGAVWGGRVLAQESLAQCVDRLAAPDGTTSAFDRLPDVRYTCMQLRSGRHVLIAEAGNPVKPAVLLVHGLGNNAHRDWRATVPALAAEFRVLLLDLPGFGASEALARRYSFPDLAGVIQEVSEHFAVKRFALVGHSLGGAVSLYFAQQHPELLERLVLVDAAGILVKPVFIRYMLEANAAAYGMGSVDSLMGVVGQLVPGGTEGMLDLLEDQQGMGRFIADNPYIRSALFGNQIVADAALGLVEHDFTTAIRDVRTPTTIIWGSDDPVTPLRTGRVLAARMPDATLKVLNGVQHMPMNQRPAEFNALLLHALTDPLVPRANPAPVGASQGDARCLNQAQVRYTGSYDTISLEGCTDARIENAQVKNVVAVRSSFSLDNVTIDSSNIALQAAESNVKATGGSMRGRIGLLADASRLDLAGISLKATERGIVVQRPSRIYFSVSDYDAPDYRGTAHLVWPAQASGPTPAPPPVSQ